MDVLKKIMISALFFHNAICYSQITFEEKYPDAYQKGINSCLLIKPSIDSIGKIFNISSQNLLPIVFPETARYSILNDAIETVALEILYVNFGKNYANFSIGTFQMKPSFVEDLELCIVNDSFLYKKYKDIIPELKLDESEKRMDRLIKMKNSKWQMVYLCCFYDIMDIKTHNIKFKNTNEKIKLYSTAYNCGFTKSVEQISNSQNLKFFPGISRLKEDNYSYSAIASDYYDKYIAK